MEEHIILDKELRRDIDGIIQTLKKSCEKDFTGLRNPDHPIRSSRERSLAITKLQEAVMWLGMDLKSIGTDNPYPNSKDPTNTTIDPTADGLKL